MIEKNRLKMKCTRRKMMIKCYEIKSKVATARVSTMDDIVIITDGILCYLEGRCIDYVKRYCANYKFKIKEIV